MRIVWLMLVAWLATGCAVNPVSKHQEFVLMSEQQELQLGQKMAAKFAGELPLLPDRDPLVQYVNEVGQKIAAHCDRPELIYRFHVVDDDTINAFALPGGYIYVHRGLINYFNDESELAAVLGHEIGHVTARHAVQRYTQVQSYQLGMAVASIFLPMPPGTGNLTDMLAAAVVQGFSRKDELQADELSVRYLRASGYDPEATVRLLETLKRVEQLNIAEKKRAGDKAEVYHGAFASHPETEKRIRQAAAKLDGGARIAAIDRASHLVMLRHLEGRPYAGSEADGAVLGQRFIHPQMGLALRFPDGWAIHNGKQALTARVRKQKVYFRLSLKQLAKHTTAVELLKRMVPARRIRGAVRHGKRGKWRWARLQADVSQPHVSEARADISVWLHGGQALVMVLWAPRNDVARWQPQFDTIVASLHGYNRARDGAVPRIALHKWRRGDSWQRLAAASGMVLGPLTARHLAILNGMDADRTPPVGTTIKLVR